MLQTLTAKVSWFKVSVEDCLPPKTLGLCQIMSTITSLICGSSEFTETFMFEAAMHWAKEGQRVIYVTPNVIEALPPKYHDGGKPTADIFQLVKFMYLPDYKSLMEVLLVELDTFVALPTALLVDKLETYTENSSSSSTVTGDGEVLVARTCSVIIDAMNACARVLKKNVHVLACLRLEAVGKVHSIYFDNIWYLLTGREGTDDDDEAIVALKKAPCTSNDQSFKFRTLQDQTIVLKQVLSHLAK